MLEAGCTKEYRRFVYEVYAGAYLVPGTATCCPIMIFPAESQEQNISYSISMVFPHAEGKF